MRNRCEALDLVEVGADNVASIDSNVSKHCHYKNSNNGFITCPQTIYLVTVLNA